MALALRIVPLTIGKAERLSTRFQTGDRLQCCEQLTPGAPLLGQTLRPSAVIL